MYELQKPYTLKGSLFFSTTVQILKNPVNFLSGLTKTREPVVIGDTSAPNPRNVLLLPFLMNPPAWKPRAVL